MVIKGNTYRKGKWREQSKVASLLRKEVRLLQSSYEEMQEEGFEPAGNTRCSEILRTLNHYRLPYRSAYREGKVRRKTAVLALIMLEAFQHEPFRNETMFRVKWGVWRYSLSESITSSDWNRGFSYLVSKGIIEKTGSVYSYYRTRKIPLYSLACLAG